jgi:pimeloyl-ACP methyl ester carboxylesterase
VLRFIDWPITLVENLIRRSYRLIIFYSHNVGRSTKFSVASLPDSAAITMALEQVNVASLPYMLCGMANDAVGLLDALDIHRRSMGGAVGQFVAINHPQHTHSLSSLMADFDSPAQECCGTPHIGQLPLSREIRYGVASQ